MDWFNIIKRFCFWCFDRSALTFLPPIQPHSIFSEDFIDPPFEYLLKYLWVGEDRTDPQYKRSTSSILVSYAITFCSNFEHGDLSYTIMRLDDLARKHCYAASSSIIALQSHQLDIDEQIDNIFKKSFLPKLKFCFVVPKLKQLSDNDKCLTANQILVGFMNFLRQILNTHDRRHGLIHEPRHCLIHELRHGLIQELTLLVAIVEDVIFQCTHHDELQEEVNNTLKEMEILANATGANDLLEKFRIFKTNITQHCMRFQELAILNLSSTCVRVDSFFIIDSLIEDLENTLTHKRVNSTLDSGIKGQIETLLDELKSSKSGIHVLQDTEEVKHLSRIRDIAYEAEYLIHSHVAGNIPIWYLNVRLPAILHKLKVNHKGLEQINKSCKESIESFGELSICQPIATPATDDYDLSPGFEAEKKEILNILTGHEKTRQVISIYGIAGLGKTTMAHKLYTCCYTFDRRAWCVVSQTYRVRELMIKILTSIREKEKQDKMLRMKDDDLGTYIHKSLVGLRYLIVLDDVWDIEVFYALVRYFPDDGNGSRIMLTSRIKAAAPENSTFHTLPFLSEVQCWDLLKKKVFREKPCPPELLSIGMGIASKCHGIPLTVVVTAGILVNLEKKASVWEKVEKHLDAYLLDDQEDYAKALELSYVYLPRYLKPCFLYLGSFHEDTEISVKKLLWLWIAEGFIPKEEKKILEEIAELYLLDLVNRSLLLTTKWRSDRGIKACRVHDLLRDLCLRKADEENFLKSTNLGFSIYEKNQRLWVPSTSSSLQIIFLSSHLRSFRGSIQRHQFYFSKIALLRVMESMPIEDVPPLLIHLRYLAISDMPKSIAKELVSIEFLCIENNLVVIKIPPEILQMVKLRHLVIKKMAEFCEDCKIVESSSLRSLSFVGIHKDEDEKVLKKMRLQKLKCLGGGRREFPNLSSLTELQSLKVVFKFSPERTILSESNFPSTIRKLHMSKSAFPWEKMSIIGKLPNLHVLKLGADAFVGKVWETRDGEFENLRFLKIESSNLREWITESEHFPKLGRFVLAKCYALSKIPSEIGDIYSLESIELMECGDEVYMSALEIKEKQLDYDNEDLQVLITSSKWTNEQLGQKYREWKEAQTSEED